MAEAAKSPSFVLSHVKKKGKYVPNKWEKHKVLRSICIVRKTRQNMFIMFRQSIRLMLPVTES